MGDLMARQLREFLVFPRSCRSVAEPGADRAGIRSAALARLLPRPLQTREAPQAHGLAQYGGGVLGVVVAIRSPVRAVGHPLAGCRSVSWVPVPFHASTVPEWSTASVSWESLRTRSRLRIRYTPAVLITPSRLAHHRSR